MQILETILDLLHAHRRTDRRTHSDSKRAIWIENEDKEKEAENKKTNKETGKTKNLNS